MNEINALDDQLVQGPATKIQELTSEATQLKAAFDYSDVVFPGPEKDFLRHPGMHSLYVAQSLDMVKIGIASDPMVRMKAMTCDNPHGIRLLAAYYLPNPIIHWVEMYCHLKLLAYHHHGEWFRVSPKVAKSVALAVSRRAAAARNHPLEYKLYESCEGQVARTGPPASIRLLDSLRDQITNPSHPKPYQLRRAAERLRKSRALQKAPE